MNNLVWQKKKKEPLELSVIKNFLYYKLIHLKSQCLVPVWKNVNKKLNYLNY